MASETALSTIETKPTFDTKPQNPQKVYCFDF